MKKKLNVLNEGYTSDLYHATTIEGLYGILLQDQFKLSVAAFSDQEQKHSNKFYFLSTSRVKKFFVSLSGLNVLLTLDGDSLARRYKTKPVDFYVRRVVGRSGKMKLYRSQTADNEYEERIISNKPLIPNAKKYIKEIKISVGKIINTDARLFKILRQILELNDNIPTYLYKGHKDITNNNPLPNWYIDKILEYEPEKIPPSVLGGGLDFQYAKSLLKTFVKIFYDSPLNEDETEFYQELKKSFEDKVKINRYNAFYDSFIEAVEMCVFKPEPYLREIITIMIKNKFKTGEEFFELLGKRILQR